MALYSLPGNECICPGFLALLSASNFGLLQALPAAASSEVQTPIFIRTKLSMIRRGKVKKKVNLSLCLIN
jgi:hypothetical protein